MNSSTLSYDEGNLAAPDIPLREPLEFEYRVNRKLAKKIYAQEKLQRVLSNKERVQNDTLSRVHSLAREYSEKERKFLEDRREMDELNLDKAIKVREKREHIAVKRQQMMAERDHELKSKERKMREENERRKAMQEKRE